MERFQFQIPITRLSTKYIPPDLVLLVLLKDTAQFFWWIPGMILVVFLMVVLAIGDMLV